MILQGDLTGTFNTGSIGHQVLLGFDRENFVQQTQQYAQLAKYDSAPATQAVPPGYKWPTMPTGLPNSPITFRLMPRQDINLKMWSCVQNWPMYSTSCPTMYTTKTV